MDKCPRCNNIVPIGSDKCNVCGVNLKRMYKDIENRKLHDGVAKNALIIAPAQNTHLTITTNSSKTPINFGNLQSRILAYFIDLVIVYLLSFLVIIFLFSYTLFVGLIEASSPHEGVVTILWPSRFTEMWQIIIVYIVQIVYFTITEGRSQGSIGKRIIGLTIIKENGGRITYEDSLARNATRFLWWFPFFVSLYPYILGPFLWIDVGLMIFGKRKQRVGDILAKTCVICST